MSKRKFFTVGLLLILVLALTACTAEAPAAPAPEEPAAVAEEVLEEVPAEPLLEDRVVIYSTHGEDMLEVVAEAFYDETGVQVDFINLRGELAERVLAEKDNPQADVMYGGASNLFMDLKAQGVFEAVEPSWAAAMDPIFKDEENFWFGTIQTPVILFYNTEMLSEDQVPGDWFELGDSRYAGQLVFRNALSSSARVMYAALLQQFENKGSLDEGWEFMKAMDANTKQYFGSGTLMMQAVGRQEAALSFSTLNHIMDNKLGNKLPIEIIDLKSGSPVITDGIAVIKDAPHPEAAKAFLEFAGSPEIQGLLATDFNRMPTLSAALENSPEWMGEVSFKVMEVDWVDLAAKQADWMQTWDLEIKDSEKDVE
jgi:iron(III) transport system substrate-binding protein